MKRAFSHFIVVLVSAALHAHQVSGAANISKTINVDLNGGGDFETIQEAIDSVPASNNQWIRIHVSAGVYRIVLVLSGKRWRLCCKGTILLSMAVASLASRTHFMIKRDSTTSKSAILRARLTSYTEAANLSMRCGKKKTFDHSLFNQLEYLTISEFLDLSSLESESGLE
ncbi:hypothetical protein COCNU_07G004360 [Cocos nucifera]|uniref:Pectinesterase n=1 Tax=Cocos nucifera TaxID=13894 RepID=A0A8K0IEY5_COCNU|nr:hypothetical protein COCNU_07G004360 [Cocos nucifera]